MSVLFHICLSERVRLANGFLNFGAFIDGIVTVGCTFLTSWIPFIQPHLGIWVFRVLFGYQKADWRQGEEALSDVDGEQ